MPRSVLARHRGELLLGGGDAGFKPFDLALPALRPGFVKPVMQVGDDLLEPVLLSRLGQRGSAIADLGIVVGRRRGLAGRRPGRLAGVRGRTRTGKCDAVLGHLLAALAEPEGAVVAQTGPGVLLRGDGDPAPAPRLPRQRPGVPTRSRNGHVAGSCGGSGVVTSCGPAWAGKSPLGSAHNAVRSADGPIRRCPTCARRRSGVGTPRRWGR